MTAYNKLAATASRAMGPIFALAIIGTYPASAADSDSAGSAPVKVATRSLEAAPAALMLGGPVMVTRADVESPLGRVRSPELDGSATGETRAADPDPAFKAVLLTPRESTGRPVQPIAPDETELQATAPKHDTTQKDGSRSGSYRLSNGVKEGASSRAA